MARVVADARHELAAVLRDVVTRAVPRRWQKRRPSRQATPGPGGSGCLDGLPPGPSQATAASTDAVGEMPALRVDSSGLLTWVPEAPEDSPCGFPSTRALLRPLRNQLRAHALSSRFFNLSSEITACNSSSIRSLALLPLCARQPCRRGGCQDRSSRSMSVRGALAAA